MSAPVWIIDDDRSIRWVLEKALARENIEYKSFASADDAERELDLDAPQVVISDIRMPGKSGLELLHVLREKNPNLPVIIMTAYSDLESAVSAFQGGAFEYLPKPFDVNHAVALIRRALEQSSRRGAQAGEAMPVPEILGQAPSMQEVFRAIGRLSVAGHGTYQRRIGHRQGAGRARLAPPRPAAGGGICRHQYRRHSQGFAGIRIVRPRARRFHRRHRHAARAFRAGRRRHAVPR